MNMTDVTSLHVRDFMKRSLALAAALAVLTGAHADAQELAQRLFLAADRDRDGAITRGEVKATFDTWATAWDTAGKGSVGRDQLLDGLEDALPRLPQNTTPKPEHVQAMLAALPEKAPARPRRPRRVLVLGKAAGFVHSSIPLAARTIEEMGKKTGAWSATITYEPADVNEKNLAQYDAIFLASTTGHFLDDPKDAAATAARKKALLDFVRGGKGLAGIHAATDTYHRNVLPPGTPRSFWGPAGTLAKELLSQGDRNSDGQVGRDELAALADSWFDKLDPDKTGRVAQGDFPQRFDAVIPPPPPSSPQPLGPTGFPVQAPATQLGPDSQMGTWPEFNRLLGGFFKFHWNDGQVITVKVDEPSHPLNAPFKSPTPLQVIDETYTFGRDTYSRRNLRVLTSIDYAAMSAEDKAKEQYPRADGDYALSWIRREGQGRVFYEAFGHNERVYAIKPVLEHVLAGMQYVLGDLDADDSPSQKP
jgi:type 1 glutamine amidotransferase